MRDADGAALPQQQLRHGFAHDVAAPDDHGIFSGQSPGELILEHHQATQGRARGQGARIAIGQSAGIHRVKTVHVLGRIDGFDHPLRADMPGQRQLHQDTVDRRIVVQSFDQGEQFALGDRRGELVRKALHAHLQGLAPLVAHVDPAGRVLAHEHHGETGLYAVLIFEARDGAGDAFAKPPRGGFAIDNCCHVYGDL